VLAGASMQATNAEALQQANKQLQVRAHVYMPTGGHPVC
jgi:hypothetical protein